MLFQQTSEDDLKLPTKIKKKLMNKQKRRYTCGDILYITNTLTDNTITR
jgi:hypothetical protein